MTADQPTPADDDEYPPVGSPEALDCEADGHPPYSMGRCYCGEVSR